MIVTLSGITGTGKSFFKKAITQELGFKNLVIVTTRSKRKDEINGIDKHFVTDSKFDILKQNHIISYNFEFLGYRYGYKTENMQSDENQVTEVHYSTIYDFKKYAKSVFAIYMIPNDIERAKLELKKRNLPKKMEVKRLEEIEEHIKEFKNNDDLKKQFDYIFVNNYDEESKTKLIDIIKNKLKKECE